MASTTQDTERFREQLPQSRRCWTGEIVEQIPEGKAEQQPPCESGGVRKPWDRLRNPSFAWRVSLVAGVHALVGTLTGGMLTLYVRVPGPSLTGFVGGAVVGAVVGGLLEAWSM